MTFLPSLVRIAFCSPILLTIASAFTPTNNGIIRVELASKLNEIDVSDLGLTMEELEAPLPSEFGVTSTGYESASRLPDVEDDACFWNESLNKMQAALAIPGLRGQPAMSLSVLTSKNTISVSAFGRVVWSCILRGEVKPETATFSATDGSDMIPVIEYEVEKFKDGERWSGFILQIGEDSIL